MKILDNTWGSIIEAYSNRYQPEGIRVVIHFYWYALLILTAVLMFVAAWYGFSQFRELTNEKKDSEAIVASPGGMPSILNRADLEMLLQNFEARRTNYELLRTRSPQLSDPSR